MNVHFSEPTLDYQTLRALAYTTYGGAEPGEVLSTAERIPEGDLEAWHAEWRYAGERCARRADAALADGHPISARGAFLRAHTYYRTAEFFLAADDPRRRPTYERSREAFRAGIDLLDTPVERVEIPYEGTTLPGYLYLPGEEDGPLATVVCLGGFDSLAEELYFLCGIPAALERGYACLAFDGPGQGAPLRLEGMTARPDWEAVVGPVLDFLEGRSEIDDERIALLGASLGGYYAPRAAAFDERVSACVAFDHCYDLRAASAYGQERIAGLIERVPASAVNALAALGARFDVTARWQLNNSLWTFGAPSAAALSATIEEYSLRGVAGRIDCPTLVLAGEDDHLVALPLAYEFVDALPDPTLRVFGPEEGAAEHCQLGNLSLAAATIYDWLDETL
ncbi:S9 family peptidase [Halalkalicoccus sp. NIPERK01]|uniref:alpha/beta hydrolase family protein n=1 Tax=Halalkalicoccus sp. NIPERK01 TaxID=3053469 RepID=UPI00256F3E37|nr:alpha/beta fold hydrolase [Halalkalicoccus sp. NIPERK01]MDL5363721.1 alpha/beta fold hydrolase [Halalkalicoccus sp. NIPERK01]